ncbi:MAG: DNA-damage-inducible protein [Parcubacteria group bacterium GW2011_GWA2_53_21]|nr:MAG: DNA-damage-inducible protein [Parcubacteria group bacterium GW2011_GWA2_53_21]
MTQELTLRGPVKDFESIKKVTPEGVEYWEARELMSLLGYNKWENFEKVIDKAKAACDLSNQNVQDHFPDAGKMIILAKNTAKEAKRKINDFWLSRYACYLIAQNGDPRKQEIALAQTYFAVQSRHQEIAEQLAAADKRLFIRNEVATQNKRLFKTARASGVSNFGKFNNAGYIGLYGMGITELEEHKNVRKGELLDRTGATELAANLFRITQTDEKLKIDRVEDENAATDTHRAIGENVRDTIRKIGGTMPEHLPVEKNIKEVKKAVKKLRGKN